MHCGKLQSIQKLLIESFSAMHKTENFIYLIPCTVAESLTRPLALQ